MSRTSSVGQVGPVSAMCRVLVLGACCWVGSGVWAATTKPAAAAKPPPAVTANPTAGQAWRQGPRPAWVVDIPETQFSGRPNTSFQPQAKDRAVLIEQQVNYTLPKAQTYTHYRLMSTDAASVSGIAQQQISFNPEYQQVLLHDLAVWRDGRREDRLKTARIELMRRERRLEQNMIDGSQTLLVVPADVRPNDVVEVAYTVEGENPIFEGRIANGFGLASGAPIDVLHARVMAPAQRKLQSKTLALDLEPRREQQGSTQVLSMVRTAVAPLVDESAVPVWVKVTPAWYVSDWESWPDVQAWAQRLFAVNGQAPQPKVQAQVQAFLASGLTGEALASEVIRFVQDDVRYFSVSLGESSHRPKPAEATLEQRLGDCKDKVVLLNTLLKALGFDAKPALVATQRLKGIGQFLPGPDQFDHVITRLVVNGKTYFVDATMTGQGTRMETRGVFDFGMALVAGESAGLVALPGPADRPDHLLYEQDWDFSQPGGVVGLTATMQGKGLTAERIRAAVGHGQLKAMGESLGAAMIRVYPNGLRLLGEATVVDDRAANVIRLTQKLEHPAWKDYDAGAIKTEFGSPELAEFLTTPREATRRHPYLLDTTRSVESRITVKAPRAFRQGNTMAPVDWQDSHLRYTHRLEVSGRQLVMTRRVERKASEVLPTQLAAFREFTQRARGNLGLPIRMFVYDPEKFRQELPALLLSRPNRDMIDDDLTNMAVRFFVEREVHTAAMAQIEPGSVLQAEVLTQRAQCSNLSGDAAKALQDADAALAIVPTHEEAQQTRATALIGLGRWTEARTLLTGLRSSSSQSGLALRWLGNLSLLDESGPAAEQLLQEAVESSGGNDREFALLWWVHALERQGGRGAKAAQSSLDGLDDRSWSSALVRHAAGQMSDSALLSKAREDKAKARLQQAEAYFYMGLRAWLRGDRSTAQSHWIRCTEQKAEMYREHTLAKQMLSTRFRPG